LEILIENYDLKLHQQQFQQHQTPNKREKQLNYYNEYEIMAKRRKLEELQKHLAQLSDSNIIESDIIDSDSI